MTKNIWEQFDDNTNLEEFSSEVEESSKGKGEFKELVHGKYEVALIDLDLVPTKKSGDPMIVAEFQIVAGDYENQHLWVNQVVDSPMKMSIGLRFINSMKPEQEVKFESMAKLASDLKVVEKFVKDNYEYVIDFSENKKGYDTYTIDTVFELE